MSSLRIVRRTGPVVGLGHARARALRRRRARSLEDMGQPRRDRAVDRLARQHASACVDVHHGHEFIARLLLNSGARGWRRKIR